MIMQAEQAVSLGSSRSSSICSTVDEIQVNRTPWPPPQTNTQTHWLSARRMKQDALGPPLFKQSGRVLAACHLLAPAQQPGAPVSPDSVTCAKRLDSVSPPCL